MAQITAPPAVRASVAETLRSLGPVAVVRMVPRFSRTATERRYQTHVVLWDADGIDLTEQIDREGHALARDIVRSAFPGRVWAKGAYDYHAGTGLLTPVAAVRTPPVLPAEPIPVMPLPEMPGGAW